MNITAAIAPEAQSLIEAVCNGIADDTQLRNLESLLLTDEKARKFYAYLLELDANLQWYVGSLHAGNTAFKEFIAAKQTVQQPVPAFPTTLPTSSSLFPSTLGYLSSGWTISYLSATVVTGLLILGFWLMPVPRPEQIAKSVLPSAPVAEPKAYVGRITGVVDCKIGDSRVSLGQEFQLASGLLEITYDTGAKVILQGPVTYSVETNGGYLAVGKLTGKLGKKNDECKMINDELRTHVSDIHPSSFILHPFSIRTPTATVTDLGTEFGVEVDREASAHVYVFSGAVRIADKDRPQGHIAHAGEAVQVSSGAIRRVEPGETSKHFVRTIGERELSPMFSDDFTGGPSRRWISTYWADFTDNNAKFTDISAPQRGYLRTLYSQYGTRDFVATVKLTNADGPVG